ncbi:HNH endonuclease [Candidatus Sulfotelmatobacter kueseliae]|uniref:HNH endonuclease n=1 Tax=Candidatus Sulfotelmatobacter kueseliae TaxID=2042962 RepID=A0A2U3KWR8_9BACT|nr:HNH endonuclease [Candidatus Sulfotelmatobacter kueseliae]
MVSQGDVVSYLEMCADFGVNLQRGMNYRLRGDESIILMSLRRGAPYADRIEDGGRVIIYEGHDIPRTQGGPDPKDVDQPEFLPSGRLTQNGLFLDAVRRFKLGRAPAERVKVFEKIRAGIWVYNGLFKLVDAWQETSDRRQVFKFKLEITEQAPEIGTSSTAAADDDRVIPAAVKIEVWKRDKGSCVKCGSRENLHFDHIIPYSQGGSSKDAENIQILCSRHNLEKRDRIE